MIWITLPVFTGFLLWWLSCWLSPLALTADRQPLPRWRLTPTLQKMIEDEGIKLYSSDTIEGYALSCYIGLQRAIVMNGPFMRHALDKSKDFVAAHEYGHHLYDHVWIRLLCHMFFLDRLRWVRRALDLTEHTANGFAENLTGYSAAVVWGPIVASEILQSEANAMTGVTSAMRGGQSTNEESK